MDGPAARARGWIEDVRSWGPDRSLSGFGRLGFGVEAPSINYSGQDFSLLGEKGRFLLPPDFRKAVRDSGDGQRVLCLDKHDRWKCLVGFGLSRVSTFESQVLREQDIARELKREFDPELRMSQLNGFMKVPFDDSGRFTLPSRFHNLANVNDQLFFQGGGTFFTMWSPEEIARMGPGWENAQAACIELAAKAISDRARK